MCLGGTKAPQIVYSGPSAEDIAGQNASLQTYMQQSAAQQEQFASSLQKQIEQTNTQAAEQRQKLEQERAAAAADMAAQQEAAQPALSAVLLTVAASGAPALAWQWRPWTPGRTPQPHRRLECLG